MCCVSAGGGRFLSSSGWFCPLPLPERCQQHLPSLTAQVTARSVSPQQPHQPVAHSLVLPEEKNTVVQAALWSHHQVTVHKLLHLRANHSNRWPFQMLTLDWLADDGPLGIPEVKEAARGPHRRIQACETLSESGWADSHGKIGSSATSMLYSGS